MEPETERRRFLGYEGLKQAFVSILIGACISFLTIVMQEIIEFLRGLDPAVTGSVAGITRHLIKWNGGRLT